MLIIVTFYGLRTYNEEQWRMGKVSYGFVNFDWFL